MAQRFANNRDAVLTANITALDSTLPIVAGTGEVFPELANGDFFLLTLIEITGLTETAWEVVKVTSRTADSFTGVERGQDNTLPRAWGPGTRIEMRMTAGISERHEVAYGWGDHDAVGYALQSDVDAADLALGDRITDEIAAVVDSSPEALNTLNELAAALGDDEDFSTTIATSIGTKWTQDNTKISNWNTAHGWGNHSTMNYQVADADGSALTNVNASKIYVTESTDDDVKYDLLYTEFDGGGNRYMTPQVDSNGIQFNPADNALYVDNAIFGDSLNVGDESSISYPMTLINEDGTANLTFNIKTGPTGSPRIAFGDTDDADIGWIRYNNTDDSYDVRAGATTIMYWRANGNLEVQGEISAPGGTSGNWNNAYAWGDHATQNYLKKGADIGSGIDLDTYLSSGYYHQNANAGAAAGSNYPVGTAGMLEVLADGLMTYQRYTGYNTGTVYTRARYQTSWTPWRTVLDTASFSGIVPSVVGTGASGTWGISITGNAATASSSAWADQVDVNSGQSTQTTRYDVVWHSGDVVYSTPAVDIQPSTGTLRATKFEVGAGGTLFSDASNRIATTSDFYVQAASANTYLYSTNTYLGNTSGDNILMRGNVFTSNRLYHNGTSGGTTLDTAGTDLIFQDTGNTGGIDYYFWRDHSASKLYLGSADDAVEIRGGLSVNFGGSALTNAGSIQGLDLRTGRYLYARDSTNDYLDMELGSNRTRMVNNAAESMRWGPGYSMVLDNVDMRFGTGNDYRMRFDGTNMYMRNHAHAGGNVYHQGETSGGTNQNTIIEYYDGSAAKAALCYAGSTKLETDNAGVTVTGRVSATSVLANTISCKTNQHLVLNAGEALSHATGQTGELVYVNAEGGLQVNSSPNNWTVNGWDDRHTATIVNALGNSSFPGDVSAPTFTGSLAGNAATATTATNAANADALGGYAAGNFPHRAWSEIIDGRWTFSQGVQAIREDGVYVNPTKYLYGTQWKFTESSQLNSAPGSGTWRHVLNIQTWSQHSSAYPSYQMSFGSGAIGVRQSTSNTAWGGWQTLLTSTNSTNWAPSLIGAGASGTWGISITGTAAAATRANDSNRVNVTASGSNSNYRMVFTEASNATDTSGNLYKDSLSNFYYNPSTNILYVPTVSGNLSGNATSATTAATATKVSHSFNRADTAIYPVLWGTANASTPAYSCAAVKIKSSTGTLYATTFSGSGASLSSLNATNISSGTINDARLPASISSDITGNAATATTAAACTGNAATATWADTVDVNSGNDANAWYPIVWHSGDSVYSTTGVTIHPLNDSVKANKFQTNDGGAIGPVTSNYGSINVTGAAGSSGSYAGVSVNGRFVLMNSSAISGLYNDTNNQWILQATENGVTSIYHAGSQKGYTYGSGWRVTGSVLATGDLYASYSDTRLKSVDGKITNALDKVEAIETFYYTHNALAKSLGYEGDERQVGVSAQSVEAVMPEVVHRAPVDDDGEGGSVTGEEYITVDYGRLVPLLIESIKELREEIKELKNA